MINLLYLSRLLRINVSKPAFEIMSKKHICELCSSEFTVKSSLNLHKQQIHEKIRFSCKQCEKSYTSKQNLEQHMQSVHEKIKHYCVYCNSSFKKTQSYKKHLQSKHTPIVRYDIPM